MGSRTSNWVIAIAIVGCITFMVAFVVDELVRYRHSRKNRKKSYLTIIPTVCTMCHIPIVVHKFKYMEAMHNGGVLCDKCTEFVKSRLMRRTDAK
jgi:hypothetical protein